MCIRDRYLIDPADEAAQQQIQQKQQEANDLSEKAKQIELAKAELDTKTASANISYLKAEIDNKKIDNKRQLLTAQDESNRKWAEVAVKAQGTEGAQVPRQVPVDFESLYQDTEEQEKEAAEIQQQGEQLAQAAIENPEQAMQMAEQMGMDPSVMMGGQQQ
jgi:uncharacterized protein (DUF3084 family)